MVVIYVALQGRTGSDGAVAVVDELLFQPPLSHDLLEETGVFQPAGCARRHVLTAAGGRRYK